MRRLVLILTLSLVFFASGAWAYTNETVRDGGTISGMVKFEGQAAAPKRLEVTKDKEVCGARPLYDDSLVVGQNGAIKNAVVTLTNISKGKPFEPAKGVEFDQKDCEYIPRVAVFPAGSTIDIINSDGILHSIHSESKINPVIDMAQPGFKHKIAVKIQKPEIIKVGCDAHNWMVGWWYVTSNPYYAITGSDGRFTIANVPPGTYTIQVWQETLGTETQKVTVKPGATATADFVMKRTKG